MRLHDIPVPQDSQERGQVRRRANIAQVLVALLFVALIGRLWYLQIARGEELRQASEENRLRTERKPAPRGEIRDRKGVLLAGTRPKFVVSVNPSQFNIDGPEGRRLSECLQIPLEELRVLTRPVGPGYKRMRVAVDIDRETVARLLEKRPWLPGVSVDLEDLRYYPNGKLGSHILGYIGPIPQKLYDANRGKYAPDARVGITGLEKQYEEELRGEDGGLIIEVDATGRRTRLEANRAPRPGADLTITINNAIQKIAEDGLTGKVGSAVALDPRTGEILAMASRPAYDPNLFARGIGVSEWRAILNDKNLPLMNRAIQSVYPPASTFKTVTALAGLQENESFHRMSVNCPGSYYLGRKRFGCWKRHNHVDFADSLSQSCDVFYYRMSRSIGVDPIAEMARKLGLGEKTGVDLPSEKGGTVPSTSWKKQYVKRDPTWHPGDTLNTSIGQGYLQATSLQMAMLTGGVAMGGKVYQPHLVKRIRSGGSAKDIAPVVLYEVPLASGHVQLVMNGLEQAVASGTARGAALPGVRVAGKTGTAQTFGKAHAWFVSVAPVDNPQIAVCVMVEHGEHGSTAAAPIAHDMMAAYFGIQGHVGARRVAGD